MGRSYLELTNRVLKALNEVQLNSSNFLAADGFSQEAKDSVNAAIFDIYTEEDGRWPFAWNNRTITLDIGEQVYTPTSSTSTINWDSFRILKDDSLDITSDHLGYQEYTVYLNTTWQIDKEILPDNYGKPTLVVRRPDNNIIISQPPDKAYQVYYEYYIIPEPLEAYDDTVQIPTAFEQLIVDKALHYAYMFRDNLEQAQLVNKRYEDNVDKVRRILIPQFFNVTPL